MAAALLRLQPKPFLLPRPLALLYPTTILPASFPWRTALQLGAPGWSLPPLWAKEGAQGNAKKENSETHLDSKTIKIMTYNVWSRGILQGLRMYALGDLIQRHNPDLVCLQEVTPDIQNYLKRSCASWQEYECVSPDEEDVERHRYYCLLMSKMPVNSSELIYWTKPKGGRGLYTVYVTIGGGKNLVLATTHLEGRVVRYFKPGRIHSKRTKKQRKEERLRKNEKRRAQAEACRRLLPAHPNVILCGDMNWDDRVDGSFPLLDGFIDPWIVLKPGENGYTYDTEANAMLAAIAEHNLVKRQLQGRLDRFFCKLEDFKIENIEIIGKEAIALDKHLIIHETPLLPSDHFGLVLTITLRSNGSANSN
ncbi:tyrosyl-DNA phosphodiesterase 2 isoform X1 [Brachypodium distachyon]|uniref:Endonuclease/exonuclease/phosphatase domain-containing protein n=1 Tax=Brachypodium distachyon TaxID=15368 RepID=A0A2K2CM45_BRADI|nr:tyrosyl-DNA phosphodiesterase 2 isoform X1 [Brachypodium distachyon]PNT63103.1 hypothetical protein BRADI_4g11470v3 [Brachypodium distachyon]PNT63105.1 hypothetical protein BRADI_4g11470v3 [Brachypodium distachyon]|eukprot:XP_024310177.1 tyrosyl-DNA phosphodiesterase 2 isoform X1 [Brachypodium distachyon]